MNRRNFLSLTGTFTGGMLVLPEFLHAFGNQSNLIVGNSSIVFIQLNGGNDGLNTFIPYENELYYDLLMEFKRLSGFGVLLNTSFNLNYEPIVNTPREAIASFYASGLDTLFLGIFKIDK